MGGGSSVPQPGGQVEPAARSFRDLGVWRKAHAWVLAIYKYSEAFPRHEMFGLSAQLRRAAVSVPANVAEGFKKRSRKDKLRFYNIAQGSLEECHYYLILGQDLGYGDTSHLIQSLLDVGRTLGSYMKRIAEQDRFEGSGL